MSMFTWRKLLDFRFAVDNDCIVFKTRYKQSPPALRFPLGGGNKKKALLNSCKHLSDAGFEPRIYGMTEDQVKLLENFFPGEFEIENMSMYDDYVYLSEKLVSLSGNKLHAKRNHLNAFIRMYD